MVVQVLDKWSIKAINRRLDKRKLQQEIDIHRLFLLTTFRQRCLSGECALALEQVWADGGYACEGYTVIDQFTAASTPSLCVQVATFGLAVARNIPKDMSQTPHA